MRHINIPIFIPHLGCPNQCIFCNQRYISGKVEFDESIVRTTIDGVLSTVSSEDICEIAFFGGSFTGIDRDLMIRLLDIAELYVKSGRVFGIRMSTRPDYISQEIIDILKKYTVTVVELGIQSMNDSVLAYLKRGHTVADTVKSAKLLKENGIPFVGQMMVGLPGATYEDEVYCAEKICELGAVGTRIYPTLVFKNTELAQITENGQYAPLTLEQAVERSAAVYSVFLKNNVECLRIGLCDSDNLHSEQSFIAGPNSPSIGEMVKSFLIFKRLCDHLDHVLIEDGSSTLNVFCAKGMVSQFVGHKRKNLIEIKNRYGFKKVKIYENNDLSNIEFKIEIKEEN